MASSVWLDKKQPCDAKDTLAERLRRRPAKPMGSPRVGSNPTGVVFWWGSGIEMLCLWNPWPNWIHMRYHYTMCPLMVWMLPNVCCSVLPLGGTLRKWSWTSNFKRVASGCISHFYKNVIFPFSPCFSHIVGKLTVERHGNDGQQVS